MEHARAVPRDPTRAVEMVVRKESSTAEWMDMTWADQKVVTRADKKAGWWA